MGVGPAGLPILMLAARSNTSRSDEADSTLCVKLTSPAHTAAGAVMPDKEAVTILGLSRLAAKHGYQVKLDRDGCRLIDLRNRFPEAQPERDSPIYSLDEAWDFLQGDPLPPRSRSNSN